MEAYFLGLYWQNDAKPLLHIREKDDIKDKYIECPEIFNMNLLSNKKVCIGTVNPFNGEYINCTKEIETNETQCNKCKYMYEFHKCIRCHGDECIVSNSFSKDYCKTSHYVYLAFFPSNKIKVGTASERRKDTRLLEQGALFSVFIAKTPTGQIARRIEQDISSNGVTPLVTTKYKINNMNYFNLSSKDIEKLLLEKYNEIVLTCSEQNKKYLINPIYNENETLLECVVKCKSINDHKNENFIIANNYSNIYGYYTFAIGKILALSTDSGIKLYDTKKLEGFLFNFKENYKEEFLINEK